MCLHVPVCVCMYMYVCVCVFVFSGYQNLTKIWNVMPMSCIHILRSCVTNPRSCIYEKLTKNSYPTISRYIIYGDVKHPSPDAIGLKRNTEYIHL